MPESEECCWCGTEVPDSEVELCGGCYAGMCTRCFDLHAGLCPECEEEEWEEGE